VVALDTFASPSVGMADIVFPVLGFAETEGTVTNLEGRVTKVNQIVPGPGSSRAAWEVLADLAARMGSSLGFNSAKDIITEIAQVAPAYAGITWDGLGGRGRFGVIVPPDGAAQPLTHIPVASELEAGPEGMALHLARVLYDGGLRVGLSPSLAKLAPEGAAYLHPADAARLQVDESRSVRVSAGGSSVELPVRLDDSLAQGTVYVPFQLPSTAGLAASPTVTVEVL
jgi:predicted molibdopterin-dependent oxidoreductase YjgC